ncbi:DUF485 domain-containing protein [Pallidibacillus pasinlerensis]|uniref:DUF485 domain-containing protein n=1 Tax=Pallidibacillus pasinlerensis TaxID=2703818 RepID=A0ABX0A7C5_9BACI|nr:DUF485 domain-containing protein [Pallidibacillus pasinlerensis]NCU17078.1 DUF485 domain-containing protein [Pallidibacillus pasinlerensis]
MAQEQLQKEKRVIDYEKVQSSPQFKQFLQRKRKFIIPMVIFFMIFYFLLPIFTSYTTFLNTSAIGDISWTWIFAFAQFIMVWTLSSIYVRKAASFDKEADEIIRDQLK